MTFVRLGILVAFLGSVYALGRYLRDRLPTSSGIISPFVGTPLHVVLWIWGPALWVFPGVLWLGHLQVQPALIVALSFLLPLCCIYLFLLSNCLFRRTRLFANLPGLAFASLSLLVLTGLLLTLGLAQSARPPQDGAYGRFGLFCLSSTIPTLVSIWLLLSLARLVVPIDKSVASPLRTALGLMLGFGTGLPKPTWAVEDAKVHTRIRGSSGRGVGPGLLITEPENVVVLKAGAQVTRVAGPGVVLLARGEVPFRVVDLRDQKRSATVEAITRDGIEVRLPVSSNFRIQRGSSGVRLGASWPHRTQRDVLQALFAEEVDPSGRSPLDAHVAQPWEDLPIKLSSHRMEQAVSVYSLDQLYSGITDDRRVRLPLDPQKELLKTHRLAEASLGLPREEELGDRLCRETISGIVRRSVRQALAPRGFEIENGGVDGPIEPVSQTVTAQRVEGWKTRFITKVMDWHAGIERKRFAALGKIRQEADAKLVSGLVEETSKRLAGINTEAGRDLVAYHLLDCLLGMARVPEVQRMLPESALPTLERLFQDIEGAHRRDADEGEDL